MEYYGKSVFPILAKYYDEFDPRTWPYFPLYNEENKTFSVYTQYSDVMEEYSYLFEAIQVCLKKNREYFNNRLGGKYDTDN